MTTRSLMFSTKNSNPNLYDEERVTDTTNSSSRKRGRSIERGDDDDTSRARAELMSYGGGRNGEAYMEEEEEDVGGVEYERLSWDALRKSIDGLVNKVNSTNIKNIIQELFSENLIRGSGLFCRSCMKSQMASPGSTQVLAALIAVVNTKFPSIGGLLLARTVVHLRHSYKRNDKPQLLASAKLIAHLVNHRVVHETIALELLTLLLFEEDKPTDDMIEVAVGFVTECGSMLEDLCPCGMTAIFERFRAILHHHQQGQRVEFLIQGLFAIRNSEYPAVPPELLDLVEPENQITHKISLLDELDPEFDLDFFKPDPRFLYNEKRYQQLKEAILGASDDDSDDDVVDDLNADSASSAVSVSSDDYLQISEDATETELANLRRTIYLTIMSGVDFEKIGHKLLSIRLSPGQALEVCLILLKCCSQDKTYLRYYGLLGQLLCLTNHVYREHFKSCFVQQYSMIHRLETNNHVRNVASFFAHLLGSDALPWHALAYIRIRLTEADATSPSPRIIFLKILLQELADRLGTRLLNQRLTDSAATRDWFENIFPRDNPRDTQFAINFFTSIGLGGLTNNLRQYLNNMQQRLAVNETMISGSSPDQQSASSVDSESGSV